MIIWLWTAWALAMECPNHNLYAHKLDAYSIEIAGDVLKFQLNVSEDGVTEPNTQLWIELLGACKADETMQQFAQWQRSWQELSQLGLMYQSASLVQKWRLRRNIRDTEKSIVIQYAQMLHLLELETGVSVLWNVEKHPLAKGMVSAGGGSPKVYRYVYHQFNHVQ